MAILGNDEKPKQSVFYTAFMRDKGICVYCGRDLLESFDAFAGLHLDHLKPRKNNGADEDPWNRVIACGVCNNLKGSYDPFPKEQPTESTFTQWCVSAKKYIDEKRLGVRDNSCYRDYKYWLTQMNRENSTANIGQAGGLCENMDVEAFLPLKSEELGSGLGRRYRQLNDLARNARNKAIEQNIAQRMAGRNDIAGWYPLVISGAPAYLCFHPDLWSQYAETPLWLRIDGVDVNRPTQEMKNRISHARFMNGVKAIYRVSDGRFWIPLFPAIGKEEVAVLDNLVEQIKVVGNVVTAEVVNCKS